MKTETILLLAALGVGAYLLFFRNSTAPAPVSGTPSDSQLITMLQNAGLDLSRFRPPTQSCAPGLVWGPVPGIVPSWGCVTPEVAALKGVG